MEILTYESYMVVKNTGDVTYDNRKLYVKTYRNGKLLPCFIPTLNGNDFIPVHTIRNLYHGRVWEPMIFHGTRAIRFTLIIIREHSIPGISIQFEVYDRDTNQIISRDTWPHTSGSTKKWMDNYCSILKPLEDTLLCT